jgi:hypothetical protein
MSGSFALLAKDLQHSRKFAGGRLNHPRLARFISDAMSKMS